MSRIKSVFPLLALCLFASSAFAADAAIKADDQSIDSACTADAQAAGCGSEVVGKGLLKCLHAYKKANKSYKFSAPCKAAMKQRRGDEKAGK